MVRRGLVIVLLALAAVFATGEAVMAVDEPTVPEQVSAYFATGLIPRLADLYGPGVKSGSGIEFDTTTRVGAIRRVLVWTPDFLAGKKSDSPTELTNNWIAPVTIKETRVVGLATVWINPASDLPELADFAPRPTLVAALAAAPKGTVLIRDDAHSAWFASDGTALIPLVTGTSGVSAVTTPAGYQKLLAKTSRVSSADAGQNQAMLVAGIVLGAVVVLLAIFVLLPDRKRSAGRAALAGGVEPADFDALASAKAPPRKSAAKTPPARATSTSKASTTSKAATAPNPPAK